jgi:hypothetical protein
MTIADRHRSRESLRSIAVGLGRAPSAESRELHRNRNSAGRYRPHYAQKKARTRPQRPRLGKIAGLPELQDYVQEMLDRWWSPGLICRQPKNAFPGRKELHSVHETIYQALYIQGTGGLSRELVKCLRTGRDRRKPNRRNVAQHLCSVHCSGDESMDVMDRFRRKPLRSHRFHPMPEQPTVEPVRRNMTDDIAEMDIRHGLVRLDGSTRWPNQEINVLLDDFADGRCALGIGENSVLRDLEGLAIGV